MSLLTAPASLRDQHTGASLQVTLYTRPLCCCCQTARDILGEYEQAFDVIVEEVDASDPALEARIGPTVPVIAVDGKVRFRGEVNRVLMDRLVAAWASQG